MDPAVGSSSPRVAFPAKKKRKKKQGNPTAADQDLWEKNHP